jgi:tetratricopeptide (TPR) repeat protein
LFYRASSLNLALAGVSLVLIGTLPLAFSQQAGDATPEAVTPTVGAIPSPSTAPGNTPEPDSLFVPIVPGGTPKPTIPPNAEQKPFAPSDIPAPAIQATPETVDTVDDSDPSNGAGLEMPSISLRATPAPTPRVTLAPRTMATPAKTSSVELPEPESTGSTTAADIPDDEVPTPTPARTSVRKTTTSKPAATPAPRRRQSTAVSEAVSGERLSQMMTRARLNRDARQATAVGWAEFQRKDYESAAMWFEQAISWDTSFGEAYYGLALTKFTTGDTTQAEAIAGYRTNSYPKMRTLLGDILVRRAMENYEAKQYAQTIEALNKASNYRTLSRNENIIRGWSYYYLRDYQSAANIFERLYRTRPDKPSAEGLYAALSRMKDWKRLERVAGEVPGPLNHIYMTYDTEQYYKSGLFVAAYDSNPKAYPALANIDSPSAAIGFEYASKSGQEGESKLVTARAPVGQVKFSPANRVTITAEVARLILKSGSPSDGALIGTPPEEFQPFNQDINTSYNDLYELKARIEYQDWLSPYLEIGSTPLNADLSARVIGKAGVQYRHAQGYVQAEFYSQPIRESVLSYVGLEDPYVDGRAWGRVQETGGSLQVFQGLGNDITAFAKGSYGVITGTNTYKNDHLSLIGSVSKLFKPEGFEYITVGPAVSYEQFNNNQNQFTYGNGGYFSPQYIIQGIIEAQALTTEGQSWLAQGSIGAGGQQNKQDASPYFPLDPDGREFPGTTSSTGIFLVKADGGVLLTPEFMVGAKLSYAITADYNEGFAAIYVRYFFEPRVGLFRSDLDFSYW